MTMILIKHGKVCVFERDRVTGIVRAMQSIGSFREARELWHIRTFYE